MNLLYLVGPPAAGKSTLMAELTRGCQRTQLKDPIAHQGLIDPATGLMVGAELGRARADFPGTDTLPMGVSPLACDWLRSGHAPGFVLAEGDRLAHMGFLMAAAEGGYRVTVGLLCAPPEVLDARCAARGSTQNEAWRRGRGTKATRLADVALAAGYVVARLDAQQPTEYMARFLRSALPALDALPEAL